MSELVLKIEGMSCNHCRAKVEQAIRGVEGVSNVKVDLAKRRADVGIDGRDGLVEDIKTAVHEAGYKVVG